MSAEIIPFPCRRKAKRKRPLQPPVPEPELEAEIDDCTRQVLELVHEMRARRLGSELHDEGIYAILDDARNVGRNWP